MSNRIIIFTTYFYPHIGGYEKNVEKLAVLLVGAGYEVDIVCCNTERGAFYEKYKGINIFRLKTLNILGGTYAIPCPIDSFLLCKKLSQHKYRAVFTQTRFFLTSFIGFLFAKTNKIRHIHTERGTSFVKQGHILVRSIAWIVDQTMGRLIVSQADYVSGVSQSAVDFSKKLGAKNPKVIFNGIDSDIWDVPKVKHNTFEIAFVGRIVEAKGVQDILYAIQDMKGIKVSIVGIGSYEETLEELVKKMDLEGRVSFLGKKSHFEIAKLFRKMDIFVNPSYTEGLPTSVMEAGASGCCVIATDVGGTREIIEHGKSGYLFLPRDRVQLKSYIEELQKDKGKRTRFGKTLQENIQKKFRWESIRDQYIELIEQ
jgi:glycosyltransferase involved in cell wall biosynthesis